MTYKMGIPPRENRHGASWADPGALRNVRL